MKRNEAKENERRKKNIRNETTTLYVWMDVFICLCFVRYWIHNVHNRTYARIQFKRMWFSEMCGISLEMVRSYSHTQHIIYFVPAIFDCTRCWLQQSFLFIYFLLLFLSFMLIYIKYVAILKCTRITIYI